jgi:RNA polymerase sigma-70 factor (ECF subfamily)
MVGLQATKTNKTNTATCDKNVNTICDNETIIRELPYLRRFARALTSGSRPADDLVHDCVVNALKNADKFEPGTNLRAWLFTILRNCFISEIRRDRNRADSVAMPDWAMSGIAPANQEDSLMLCRLRDELSVLPTDQRTVLLLVVLEGMSYEETAEALKIPVGTVRSRLSRARHALRRSMDGETMFPGSTSVSRRHSEHFAHAA